MPNIQIQKAGHKMSISILKYLFVSDLGGGWLST